MKNKNIPVFNKIVDPKTFYPTSSFINFLRDLTSTTTKVEEIIYTDKQSYKTINYYGNGRTTIEWDKYLYSLLFIGNNDETVIFSNPKQNSILNLIVKQSSYKICNVLWQNEILWEYGNPPYLTPKKNALDLFTFIYIGGKYYGKSYFDLE